MQDEFEVSRGLFLNAQQVVQSLTPLMTPERIQRLEQARVVMAGGAKEAAVWGANAGVPSAAG